MSFKNPFFRTCRQFIDGSYSSNGKLKYIEHPDFAKNALHFIRPFFLIQKDLLNLFDYIEPSDINLNTYSYRIHELFMRACVEIEANFKAILRENEYIKNEKYKWNMSDYKKVEASHFLSGYQVILPIWDGQCKTITPFELFKNGQSLVWYEEYHNIKHDRYEKFKSANFKNLVEAVSGLLVLLSAQFYTCDFSSGNTYLALKNSQYDNSEAAIGGYFRIIFPNIPEKERYDFEYNDIKNTSIIFKKYNYK